jgi:protein TonB
LAEAAAANPQAGGSFSGDRAAGADLSTTGGSTAESDRSVSGSASVVYVPISALKRTNYVAPRYPRSALRRNITGWVDVSFKVNLTGNVIDVNVLDSTPRDVFNEAATEAVTQWRFEPSLDNGTPVEKLVTVRLMFNLE